LAGAGKIKTQERFAQLYVNVPAAAGQAVDNPAKSCSPRFGSTQDNQGLATTISLKPEILEHFLAEAK